MKTYNKPSTSKLVARFDNELKNLLMEDLKAFRDRNKFVISNKQIATKRGSLIDIYIYHLYITYENDRAQHFAGLYFFAAYFIIKAAVFADAPGWPIRTSSSS